MTPLVGPVHAAALVLLLAGIGKGLRPAAAAAAMRTVGVPGSRVAVRAVAAGEILVAGTVLAGFGRPAAAALALAYASFAVVAASLRRRSATCGCFGEAAPVTGTHLVVNGLVAAVAVAAVADPVPSVGAAVAGTPGAGVPYLVLLTLLAAGQVLCLTALAELQSAAAAVRGGAGATR